MLTPEELALRRRELEEKRQLKRQRKRRRLIYYSILTIAAIIIGVMTAFFTYNRGIELFRYGDAPPVNSESDAAFGRAPERVNVLVLGVDGEEGDLGRTDTIILASIDPSSGNVTLFSIPRDTRVQIPGRKGYDRVNAAHVYGGPKLAMAAVSELLDIPIKYYVRLDFEGFKRVVDILGGVEIDVERRMKYSDYAQGLHIDLYPGLQRLNGEDALSYVRFRADGLGDVALVDPAQGEYGGRIRRQQRFIHALGAEVLQAATITKIPALSVQLWDCVSTNVSLTQMLSLGLSMRDFDSDSIVTALIPGIGDNIDGVSYWVPNRAATQALVDQLIRGKEPVTVRVLNGSGAVGAAGYAAARLREQGYQVVNIGNAQRFGYRETEVLVNPERKDVGAQIADIFGTHIIHELEADAEQQGDDNCDVMVIVGESFFVPQL
ncbi:MAG: LCP family protein [Firmicutes bacterium]|nr:LCP family protein [Bacillota bacterium]